MTTMWPVPSIVVGPPVRREFERARRDEVDGRRRAGWEDGAVEGNGVVVRAAATVRDIDRVAQRRLARIVRVLRAVDHARHDLVRQHEWGGGGAPLVVAVALYVPAVPFAVTVGLVDVPLGVPQPAGRGLFAAQLAATAPVIGQVAVSCRH